MMESLEKDLGADHPALAKHLGVLSRLAQERGAYEEAESLCSRALQINEKALGGAHPEVGAGLNSL
ncbi:unnamed protein product, partial [Choristocarpus tenellus]